MSKLDSKIHRARCAPCLLAVIVACSTAFADDEAKVPTAKHATEKPARLSDRVVSAIRDREAVQMVTAVVSGSQMGPGDGWFHPSQSRYGWMWLAERHQIAADGEITAEAFQGDEPTFEQLDRNHDGAIRADDFDWSSNSPFVRQTSQASQWFRGIDASGNGQISREEWDKYFDRVAGLKEFATPEDLRAALFPPPPRGAMGQGPSQPTLIKGLLAGELGSFWEGPALNSPAPDFELKTQDRATTIRLSSFREQKPVVLIFGSFT
jgi:hypothetical protein